MGGKRVFDIIQDECFYVRVGQANLVIDAEWIGSVGIGIDPLPVDQWKILRMRRIQAGRDHCIKRMGNGIHGEAAFRPGIGAAGQLVDLCSQRALLRARHPVANLVVEMENALGVVPDAPAANWEIRGIRFSQLIDRQSILHRANPGDPVICDGPGDFQYVPTKAVHRPHHCLWGPANQLNGLRSVHRPSVQIVRGKRAIHPEIDSYRRRRGRVYCRCHTCSARKRTLQLRRGKEFHRTCRA